MGIQLTPIELYLLIYDAVDECLDLGVVAHEATLRNTDEPLEGADLVGSNVDTLTLESTLTLDQSDSCRRLTGMLGNSYLAREAFIVHRGIGHRRGE